MKSLFFFHFFFIFFFISNAQEVRIIDINKPQGYLILKYNNTTNQKIIVYENSLYTRFELWNSERIIGHDSFTKEYDAFNFTHNFSNRLIEETKKKYNIDSKQAFFFLQYTKCKITIPPKSTKVLKLKAFDLPTKPLKPMEKADYYIEGTVFFNNVFYPEQFVDSLSKNNIMILDKIDISKTKIDIDTFFSKELGKLPKGFKYDEAGKVVLDEEKKK